MLARLIIAAALLNATLCYAQIRPADDAPQPMDPAASAASIKLPEGFRIELVASEPVVLDPSCIAFDEHGRVFVCELHGYNVEGHIDVTELNKSGKLDMEVRRIRWELKGGEIADRAAELQYGVVKLLSDTNGDGVLDKAQTWADDLPPAYGVVAARDGIIVTCAPDIVFLADRDGDGVADHRETLFTGFPRRFMERGVNNPRWGLDNWIYVGGGDQGGTITGPHLPEPVHLGNTDFRIKPDGSAIEPVNGRVGTFGMTINSVGDRFPSSGGQPAIYALPLPYRYLARNPWVTSPDTNLASVNYNRGFRISDPHPWRVRRAEDPQWVKFYGARETNSNYFSGGCSNEFYGDPLFPEQYRGNLFYCEPSLNIIHRCIVDRDGAGYRGRRAEQEQKSEFLAATDQWFRPMNLRVGPEGALYVVDMYREIIEDYSAIPRFLQQQYGLDRGGDFGRIWRLVPEAVEIENLASASRMHSLDDTQLVQRLQSPHAWQRQTAKRILVDRDAKVADLLTTLITEDAAAHTCIDALYALRGLGQLQPVNLRQALRHDDYGVRLHALRLCESWLDSDEELLEQVIGLTEDEDPSVRLQSAMSLGQSSDERIDAVLLNLAATHGDERWMDAAIVSSSNDRSDRLLTMLLRQPKSISNLTIPRQWSATIAGRRDSTAISRLLRNLGVADQPLQIACLRGLADGLSRGSKRVTPADDGFASLTSLLHSRSDEVRELATKLSVTLPVVDDAQLQLILARAKRDATNSQLSLSERCKAVEVLGNAPLDVLAQTVTPLLDSSQPPSLQIAAIRSLGTKADSRVAIMLLEKWPSHSPNIREEILQAVFSRVDRLEPLLNAVEAGVVMPGEINATRRETLLTHPNGELAARTRRLLESRSDDQTLSNRIATYASALAQPRDHTNGRLVFTKHCQACHKLGEEGHEIGPSLGTILNKPDETVLVDLLDPSSRIEPEYRSYIVLTKDGRSFTGILASESATNVTLRQEKDATQSVLRANIEVMKASDVSLMPSNLHEQLSAQDTADLIGFLRAALANTDTK